MFLEEKRKGKKVYQKAPGSVVAFARELDLRVGCEGGACRRHSISARITRIAMRPAYFVPAASGPLSRDVEGRKHSAVVRYDISRMERDDAGVGKQENIHRPKQDAHEKCVRGRGRSEHLLSHANVACEQDGRKPGNYRSLCGYKDGQSSSSGWKRRG